jgi:hypothetical protein
MMRKIKKNTLPWLKNYKLKLEILSKNTNMKTIVYTFFLSAVLLVPLVSFAAPECTAGTPSGTDPACYTESGSSYSCTVYSAGSGSYWACDGGYQTTNPSTGTNCFAYLSALYDTCGNYYGCANRTDEYQPGYTFNVNNVVQTCHYIDSVTSWSPCAGGTQVADTVHWGSKSGTSCPHVPLNRSCCDTAQTTLEVDGSTVVTQKAPFNLTWTFANPGYEDEFSCTLTTPSPTGFINDLPTSLTVKPTAETAILSGTLSDTVQQLANFSNSATVYPYTLDCTPTVVTPGCQPSSKKVDVTVTALPFKITVVPDGDAFEIGSTVDWKVTAEGGYPPYKGAWSGTVVTPWGALTNVSRKYGTPGIRTVQFDAEDSDVSPTSASDSGSVIIEDNRIQQ